MSRKRKKGKSANWHARQQRDPYVKQARQSGFRARAVYKLEQMDQKYRLIRPGSLVVDLGSAPGSWSQYAARRVSATGQVIAVDLLSMDAVDGVTWFQGDFTETEMVGAILDAMAGRRADLVMSDMAPNITGIRAADQARAESLQIAILDFCSQGLRNGGKLLTKLFEGESVADLRKRLQGCFQQVHTVKPEASRSASREIYLLGVGYRGPTDNPAGDNASGQDAL